MRCDHSIEALQMRRDGAEQSPRGAACDEEAIRNECLRILTIVDDEATARTMLESFEGKTIHQELTSDASHGMKLATTAAFDAIVVDSHIAGTDGATWISALRDLELNTPCLLLLERNHIDSRSGRVGEEADDFLLKPFAFSELHARLHRIARRPRLVSEPAILRFADLEMNLITRRVTRGGRPIRLPPRQFQLLELLMKSRGRVVSRRSIMERLSVTTFELGIGVVQANVSRLRAQIDRVHEASLIRTVRGLGYSLQAVKGSESGITPPARPAML